MLSEQLQLCYPLQTQTDMSNLFNWINNAIQYMAMADYPYPASFLGPMPGNPVNVSCSYFTNPNPTNAEMLTSIKGTGSRHGFKETSLHVVDSTIFDLC